MRVLSLIALAATALVAQEAFAQQRTRERSPEREAQHEICREESRRALKAYGPTVADRERTREYRRAYVRDCMRRTRP